MTYVPMRWLCLAATLAIGCGGDDDGGGAGEMVTVDISAAEGGDVEIGAATLSIPAGALAEDTTITAATLEPTGLPDADSLTGLAYDFGPDGLEFLMPVSLDLPVAGSPAEGQEAVISWLDESTDTWTDVATTISGGTATAEIMHFTTFIVRFRDAGPVDCTFSACGGDITGAWDIAGLCADFGDENPFGSFCATSTIEVIIDGSGSVSFNSDLTYTVDLVLEGSADVHFPATCTSAAPSCQEYFGDEQWTCTGTPATGCDCTSAINPGEPKNGTYTTSGNSLVITETDGQPETSEYCVAGDTLKVKSTSSDSGATFVYTATR